MISDEDLQYLAALIDGEGCIRTHSDHRYYRARIRVGMKDPEAVRWAHKKFGGTYYRDKKGTHFWTMNGEMAVVMLEIIRPYLKLKRRRVAASRAIEFNGVRIK